MRIHTLIAELQEIQVEIENSDEAAKGEIWVANAGGGDIMRTAKHVYLDGEGDVVIVTKRSKFAI